MGLVQKSFSDIITFSRSSNATRVGPTGLVEYAPHNLCLQSQTFDNASWSKFDATITANSIAAPDGTVTADKIVEAATAGVPHLINQSVSVTAAQHTFSVYAKAAERRYLLLYNATAGYGQVFDLLNGVLGTASVGTLTAAISSVGNGWYRCLITGTASAGANTFSIYLRNTDSVSAAYTGDGTSGIYIWGAQLAVGPYALDYTPTTSAAVYGPRFDYDPTTLAARGLLVEESRSNLVTYSEQFDNAAWIKLNASVTANAATSPDGTVSADLLIPDTSSNQHGVYQALGATAGVPYTQSIFAKAAGYNWLFMTEGNNVSAQASFNLVTGVVGTVAGTGSPSATITSFGNGWYRCTLTYTPIATSQNIQARAANADGGPTFAGNGTSGIYIWGAQLEAGSFATSLIPTLASTVTRSADVASVNTLSPWFNATTGTLFAEGARIAINSLSQVITELGDGTINNITELYAAGGATTAGWYVGSGGSASAQIEISGVYPALTVSKVAGTYAANSFQFAANGTLGTRDTSGAVPSSMTTLFIGKYGGTTTNQWNGWIRRIAYYPRALSDAELQALTA